jgi:hypothetical protein
VSLEFGISYIAPFGILERESSLGTLGFVSNVRLEPLARDKKKATAIRVPTKTGLLWNRAYRFL